ncbi:MAG: sensor domain-containing diguanylate cyclase [Proteobacteria bacterium]|nr:sensor domain-containing diguanylate cyclase [Pseudomonadota bacterium]MCZ6783228.1 sensor domain-containing diguanylate cyclase [Pseudomonadota bacterium]
MLSRAEPPQNESLRAELARLERRNSELELLYDTIRDLTSTLSVHQVLSRLLDRTLEHLGAEIGSILLVHPDERLRLVLARGLPDDVVRDTVLEVGEGISGHVARSGEALLVKDVERDDRFRRRNNERYYTHSFISAPLLHQHAVRGVVNVNNKCSRQSFEATDLRLLEAIAGHASVALANAHQYEEVLERARRDSLTGLADQGHFWSSLEVEHGRTLRYQRPLAVVMLDIDHFKRINDQYGHPAGDQALRAVARRIELNSRVHDTVARYGGEEFAIILPETTLEGGVAFAEKIRCAVDGRRYGPDGSERLTVSAGVAALHPGEKWSARELVEIADARLYRAKHGGRNAVCGHDGTA